MTYQPTSLLIRAELADLMAHPPGHPGTVTDLLSDAREMADYPTDYQPGVVADMIQTLCRVLDEVNGLLK